MNTVIYTERRTFEKYDDQRYMVYLGEKVIPDYTLPAMDETPREPVTGYSYTGTEADGGTLIGATGPERNSLINGIIRTKYSQTEEDAIKTHQIELLKNSDIPKAGEYEAEWEAFNTFRISAIATVDRWLE